MKAAFVTVLVVLGASLAVAEPLPPQRRSAAPATDVARQVRQAAAEPADDNNGRTAVSPGDVSSPGKSAPAAAKQKPARKKSEDKAAANGKVETDGKGGDGAPVAELKAPKKIASGTMDSICLIMESAASANGLPLEFFARVIWQESRFQPDAVGPVTRSGHRAQGIAQFMPRTAEERGLLDPFNPVAALPKAAEFLRELRGKFGNLGLAAAAYNAGPRRVQDYLDGRGGMPGQTRHYVMAITGRSVDDWVSLRRNGGRDGILKPASCLQLASLMTKQPSFFVGELERRVTEGKLRPWGVQLSAGFSRGKVLAAYARIERRYRGLLEKRDPMIIRSVLRSRGTRGFYQVRVGVDSRGAADRLCAALSAKGAACMVLRNSRGSQSLLSRADNPAPKQAALAKEDTAKKAPVGKRTKRTRRVRRAREAKR